MSLSGQFQVVMNLLASSSLDLGDRQLSLVKAWGPILSSGAGADAAEILYADTITLADGGNVTLDFHDGSLVDVLGNALTLSELKGLVIRNHSADATLQIGAAAGTQLAIFAAPANDILLLPPGSTDNPSTFLWCVPSAGGLDVTTNADLKLTHNGTGSSTMDVDIVALGSD